ncbi:MAG: hypothetical protein AB1744_08840 [Candidatus Zixiibacteriota bacterium]
MNLWERLGALDRRWIYLLVAISVVFPLIVPMSFKISVTPEAQQLYDAVEALPDSSVVLLTFDYYPSTVAETEPMTTTALHHLFRKDCRVLTLSTIPLGGPSMAERVTRSVAKKYRKEYGIDFVNLGYKANYVAVLQGLGSSIESIYPTDNRGTPLSELPMMANIKNYDDISFIFVVADNDIVTYWIAIVNAQYGTPVGTGVTAVSAPQYFAYIGSGQMTGMLGGMKGAAEYELLVGKPDKAEKGMGMQSLVHLMIIFMVIVGNVAFFAGRRSKREKPA